MRIKAKLKDGVVVVKVQMKHDMTTYDQAAKKKDSDGKIIGNREDANFITRITASVNGKIVFETSTSQFLAKNPILKFKFNGAVKGDKLEMTWVDRKGNTNTDSTKIK